MRKVPTGPRPASHRRRNASSRGTIRPRSALPINKGRRVRCSNQPLYRRRRRLALLVLVLLLVLLLVVVLAVGSLGVGGWAASDQGRSMPPPSKRHRRRWTNRRVMRRKLLRRNLLRRNLPRRRLLRRRRSPFRRHRTIPRSFLRSQNWVCTTIR